MRRYMIIGLMVIMGITFSGTLSNALPPIEEIEKMYSPESVVTVRCSVDEVGKVYQVWGPIKGKTYGVHLEVKTNTESLTVYLGPAWYVEKQNFTISKDDTIHVKGCKKVFEGESFIVAEEIRKGDMVLKLRDADGTPVWADRGIKKVSY